LQSRSEPSAIERNHRPRRDRPMTAGEYLLGGATIAVVAGSLALGAWTLRRQLLPGWAGAPARLAEAILACSGFVVASELLGSVGLFKALPLVLTSIALALA